MSFYIPYQLSTHRFVLTFSCFLTVCLNCGKHVSSFLFILGRCVIFSALCSQHFSESKIRTTLLRIRRNRDSICSRVMSIELYVPDPIQMYILFLSFIHRHYYSDSHLRQRFKFGVIYFVEPSYDYVDLISKKVLKQIQNTFAKTLTPV